MSRRTYGLLAIVLLATFCVCIVIANNCYWGATSCAPGPKVGENYLFKRRIPDVAGQLVWLSVRPLSFVVPIAASWFLYRYFHAVAAARRIGFCPKCGYDLRGTPGRCPECGTLVEEGVR